MKKCVANFVSKYRLSMVAESDTPYPICTQPNSPEKSAQLFFDILSESAREQFVVLLCNVKRIVTGYTVISAGTKSHSLVSVGEVFTAALHGDAQSIIVGHNHPSGDCAPSREDRSITTRLVEAGRLLDCEVTDHIIVASGVSELKYYSFAEWGFK